MKYFEFVVINTIFIITSGKSLMNYSLRDKTVLGRNGYSYLQKRGANQNSVVNSSKIELEELEEENLYQDSSQLYRSTQLPISHWMQLINRQNTLSYKAMILIVLVAITVTAAMAVLLICDDGQCLNCCSKEDILGRKTEFWSGRAFHPSSARKGNKGSPDYGQRIPLRVGEFRQKVKILKNRLSKISERKISRQRKLAEINKFSDSAGPLSKKSSIPKVGSNAIPEDSRDLNKEGPGWKKMISRSIPTNTSRNEQILKTDVAQIHDQRWNVSHDLVDQEPPNSTSSFNLVTAPVPVKEPATLPHDQNGHRKRSRIQSMSSFQKLLHKMHKGKSNI